jgi:DNA-binding winged helix-turn-helix (wHTH) protein/pimeloyl-ACP methyl ester carboxylesterase
LDRPKEHPVQYHFADHVLDTDRQELRRGALQIAVEPQVFDLLVYLLQNRDRVVSSDDLIAAVWQGRIVSDSTLTSRINAVRRAIGDNGEQQRLIRTVRRKGFRFVGDVEEMAGSSSESRLIPVPEARQRIRFCAASDGIRIAYAESGSGPALVKAANWLNHLEYDWESPVWRHLLHGLSATHRLIRYDQRGTGLSDWDVGEISFDAFVQDLTSVIDAVAPPRFALLGISQGCAASIAYAVRHPKRVTHLVLYGGFARGRRWREGAEAPALIEAFITLIRHGWGQENPAFRQIFTSQFIPGGTPDQVQWFNDLQRITASPQNALRLFQAMWNLDVSALLERVRVPTLVLHCRNDLRVPFEAGRQMAADIPGARFVALEGQNHIILESDPAWPRFLEEVQSFLSG